MDLVFSAGLVLTVLLSVLITGQVAGDGRSDWLKGVQLLAVYVILGLAFFFVTPGRPRTVIMAFSVQWCLDPAVA